jgi:uncharacterized protein (DUF1501 family)
MTQFNRRQFLNFTLRGVATTAALNQWFTKKCFGAVSQNYRALVCVFLAGGNDGHNMIIPIATSGGDSASQKFSDYSAVRPVSGIGLTQSQLLPIMVGKDQYGLHPSLVNIAGLYASNKVALLANVGNLVQPTTGDFYRTHQGANDGTIPDQLMSHTDQSGEWDAGLPTANPTTGWGGRIADLFTNNGSPLPMNMLGSQTIFGTGNATLPGTFGQVGNLWPIYQGAATELLSFDAGINLVQACNAITASGINQQSVLNDAVNSVAATASQAISIRFHGLSGNLAGQLKTVAQIIAASGSLGITQQIFYVILGSFDTHQNERAGGGQDDLLSQLDGALSAFYLFTQDLGISSNVTTFTASEFGRNLIPNTALGTDHAWGNHHLVVGGSVRGGNMYGTFPTLRLYGPDDISNGPNSGQGGIVIPTTSTAQYAATLAAWFGVDPNNGNLAKVFPTLANFQGFNPITGLGFL